MKTYFADPELKVIRFEAMDVLTTSPGDPNTELETGENELPGVLP